MQNRLRVYALSFLVIYPSFLTPQALAATTEIKGYGYGHNPIYQPYLRPHVSRSFSTTEEDYYIRRALSIKDKVERGNYKDIHALLKLLRIRYERVQTTQDFPKSLLNAAVGRIRSDKEVLASYKQYLDTQAGPLRGSCALRSCLEKLLGSPFIPGILDNSIRMLNESNINLNTAEIDGEIPSNNKITVLKSVLYYLVIGDRELKNFKEVKSFFTKPKFFYPAILPNLPDFKDKIMISSLYDEDKALITQIPNVDSTGTVSYLQIPNAGYVFGGDWIQGKCCGIDCSAFVSYITHSSARMITETMEFIWRHKTNDVLQKAEKARVDAFLRSSMARTLNEYDAVDFKSPLNIRRADLVVWRSPINNSRGGHVALFLEWVDPKKGEFIGIDASRGDQKSWEGVGIRLFSLDRENHRTYVVRRTSYVAEPVEPTEAISSPPISLNQ